MFTQSVASVLPLLTIIAVGYIIAPKPWFGKAGMAFLAKIDMSYAIPVYLFHAVTTTYTTPAELAELAYNLRFPVVMIGVTVTVAYAAATLFRIKPPMRGIFIHSSAFSNTILMGLPVASALFGEASIPIIMVYYSTNTLFFWLLGVWLLRRELPPGHSQKSEGSLIRRVLSPPLAGFLLGILWVLAGLSTPVFLTRVFVMAGNIITPVAMLFIGSVIRFTSFKMPQKAREILITLVYRYTAVPILAAILCSLLPMEPLMKKVSFLLANMPVMAQLPIVAQNLDSDYESASLIVAVTTTLSMAAVPVIMFVMSYTQFLD